MASCRSCLDSSRRVSPWIQSQRSIYKKSYVWQASRALAFLERSLLKSLSQDMRATWVEWTPLENGGKRARDGFIPTIVVVCKDFSDKRIPLTWVVKRIGKSYKTGTARGGLC